MQIYDVILSNTDGLELSRSNFEAADDTAARDLIVHYYAGQRCELLHDGRLVMRHDPALGEALA